MNITTKDLKHKGKTEKVHFRGITARDQLQLSQGQKIRTTMTSGEVELDLGAQVRTGQLLVFLTRVNEVGTQFYQKMDDLLDEDGHRMKKLISIARDVHKDEVEDAGNV